MKKALMLLLILAMFILLLVGCNKDEKNVNNNIENNDSIVKNNQVKYKQISSENSYLIDYAEDNEGNKIIDNLEEFNEFTELLKEDSSLKKYNEEYFKNNSLGLVLIITGNASQEINIINIETKQNDLNVKYEFKKLPDDTFGEDVLGVEVIIIELEKNVNKINVVKE